ncbi:hypothetical protein CRYUN_Cryun17cG0056300 [Craigia yunnanensis]
MKLTNGRRVQRVTKNVGLNQALSSKPSQKEKRLRGSRQVEPSEDSISVYTTMLPSLFVPEHRLIKWLPKKKPLKWSTDVAPVEYGGPPTTSKLRKYWGGEEDDPLTSDDFIWNKDFVGRMKKLIQDPAATDDSSLQPSPDKEEPSGFLSLNRVRALTGFLEVDLSKELTASSKPVLEQAVESSTQSSGIMSCKWKLVPTRHEQEKWDNATKAATGGSDVMFRELRRPQGDPEVLAAHSREQYFKLKKKMQVLTLVIGGVGLVSAYVSYSPEVTASFGAGLLGSLAYMHLLGSSVDSLAEGAKGLMKGAVAQPRVLVPVVLVMIYNRWNE